MISRAVAESDTLLTEWNLRYGVGFTSAGVVKVHPILVVAVPLPVVDVHPCKATNYPVWLRKSKSAQMVGISKVRYQRVILKEFTCQANLQVSWMYICTQ